MFLYSCLALPAEADFDLIIQAMADSRRFVTGSTDEHQIGNIHRARQFDRLALFALALRPNVLFVEIQTLHAHAVGFLVGHNHLPGFSAILSG